MSVSSQNNFYFAVILVHALTNLYSVNHTLCTQTQTIMSVNGFIRLDNYYTVFQKKGATLLMAITSSNLDRFSKFFHHWKEREISNKTHILFPTTP